MALVQLEETGLVRQLFGFLLILNSHLKVWYAFSLLHLLTKKVLVNIADEVSGVPETTELTGHRLVRLLSLTNLKQIDV